MTEYKAPWTRSLSWISWSTTGFICVLAAFCLAGGPSPMAPVLLAIPAVAALFAVRGYAVAQGELRVRRLLWDTRIPLADLESAEFVPDAMRRSIRTFGNGGLFSFTGRYRSKALGGYRAFVTDLGLTVVLRFRNATIVVSPETPEAFVRHLLPYRRPA